VHRQPERAAADLPQSHHQRRAGDAPWGRAQRADLAPPGAPGASRVSDTGIGIPQSQLADIFNPFFTTKSPGQGTGLGLSVVHSVVRRYHGDIQVRSVPNVGTTFTIELPSSASSA